MEEQLELFPVENPKYQKSMTLQQRFEFFHLQNPHIATMLIRYAKQLQAAGKKRLSINLLFERIRFDYAITTRCDEFKVNNSYRSRYARWIMKTVSSLNGLFETRELKS